MRSFQYRILMCGIVTNQRLFYANIKIVLFANSALRHLCIFFTKCNYVTEFYTQVIGLVNRIIDFDTLESLEKESVFFKDVKKPAMHITNFLVLLAKYYMYKKRCEMSVLDSSTNQPIRDAIVSDYIDNMEKKPTTNPLTENCQ